MKALGVTVVLVAGLLTAGCEQPYRVFAVQVAAAPSGPGNGQAWGRGVRTDAPPVGESGLAGRRTQWDVNLVGEATLGELPGITPGLARAIIAGRPYRTKRELLTHRVVTAEEYDRWKAYLVVHRGKPGRAGVRGADARPR
jgi:hypothetical protein